MILSDRVMGRLMLFAAVSVFVYYTIWAILLPFFEESSPIHTWFPSREWAVRMPAFILVLGVGAVSLFVGTTVVEDHRRMSSRVHAPKLHI